MANEIIVSVIVPVFNGEDFVPNFIKNLGEQQPIDGVELIFIDNGSTDSSLLLLKKLVENMSETFVFVLDNIKSSYAARNKGILAARGAWIAFTDIDCQPDSNWLRRCLFHAISSPTNRIYSGPVTLFPSGTKPNIYELYDIMVGIRQEDYFKGGFGATANLLVPAHIFTKIGLFSVVTSGGDSEFCGRAINSEFVLEFDPSLIVNHPARKKLSELLKKAQRIGRGKAERYYTNKSEFYGKAFYLLKSIIGLFLPRYQFTIILKLFHCKNQTRIQEKIKVSCIILLIGFVERLSGLVSIFNKRS